jgi:DNA mismatch endonuclease (patch repair protein)
MPDVFDKATRSKIMSKIRSKDTGVEKAFKEALIRNGLTDFEMHYKIMGKPDFVFVKEKVAVFCDSLFWHGKKNIPQTNREYWIAKFQRNMRRDKVVTQTLKKEGWKVVRFYDNEILKDADRCAKKINKILSRIRSSQKNDLQ